MPEKTFTSSPSSRQRSCRVRAASLLCPADLPGVSLAVAESSSAAQPRHVHDSLTLGLVTAGARRIETQSASVVVACGEAFALPPGLPHACAPVGGACSYLALSIETRALPPELTQGLGALPLRLEDGGLAALLSQLREAVVNNADALERQSLLADVLERLAEHAGNAPEPCPEKLAGAVERAKTVLEENPASILALPELAEACGADALPLHRAFTRMVGLPPHAYRTHLRLRRAKELLRAGASPTDAALEAGFCDQSHLNRHFARSVGLTPAQYVQAHRPKG